MKLNKGVNPGNNKPIYFLTGNTYPIRDKIKQLGFRWYDNKQGNKFWWAYPEVITSYSAESLRRLGFDVSEYSELGSPSEQAQQNQNTPGPTAQPVKPTTQVTDQSYDGSDQKSKWYGFPIKKNIYSGKISVMLDDQPRELLIQVDRDFATGRRRVPSYTIHISNSSGQRIRSLASSSPEQKEWKQYDETADVINKIPEMIQKFLDNKEKSKLYNEIKKTDDIAQRTPELLQFIKDHEKYGEKRESIVLNIDINESPYVGSFPVSFYTYGNGDTWYGETAVKHPLATHPKTIYHLELSPSVHTIEEFNQWLQQSVYNPKSLQSAQSEYVKYLKSFAFLEEQQNAEKEQLDEILPLIQSRSMDTSFFRTKLIQKGYIRPSKKQKQQGAGMVPQSGIDIVLDSKKIVDDIYKWGAHSNSPDFFYAVVAYVVHRHKAGNIGFMPIMIDDSVRKIADNLMRHGIDISRNDLYTYIDTLAKKLLQEILHIQARGSSWDQYTNFNSWFNDARQRAEETVIKNFAPETYLNRFVEFANQHGIPETLSRSNPKAAYKQLAMRLHPDLNQQNPMAHENMKQLNALWEPLADSYRSAAVNWWTKLCFRGNDVVI